MKARASLCGGLLSCCIVVSAAGEQPDYTVVHKFSGGTGGEAPTGTLASAGSVLYGMTGVGGAFGLGTIFSFDPSTNAHSVIHNFDGGGGRWPHGSLIFVGGSLYGMTPSGTIYPDGVLFSWKSSDTPQYKLLHAFGGFPGDGSMPRGGLLSDGTTLYGMTKEGGLYNPPNGDGTLFSLTIAQPATSYTVVRNLGFFGGGTQPQGGLVSDGSILYGMTYSGGTLPGPQYGVLFSIDPAQPVSSYTNLRSFQGGAHDGSKPVGDLLLDGTTLYGMTSHGGPSDDGVIFAIGASGSGFTLLHSFAGPPGDGALPLGSLLMEGGRLYGLTSAGGQYGTPGIGDGTLFSIMADGTHYTILHHFGDPAVSGDGAVPLGGLVSDGSALYGTTHYGGGSGQQGTIFSYALPTPTPQPTATPPIDLTANKTEFGTTDSISVTADVWPLTAPCYPFVRIQMADGSTLYYQRDVGFTPSPVPYLGFAAGTITTSAPILGYPALSANFSGIATGTYILEGGAVDMTKTTSASDLVYFGRVDQETLKVR